MFTLDGKTWYRGDPDCTELEPVTGFTPEECQEMQESLERVMAAQADNPDYGYPGKYPYPHPSKEKIPEMTFLLDKLLAKEKDEKVIVILQELKALLSRLAGGDYPYPQTYPYSRKKGEIMALSDEQKTKDAMLEAFGAKQPKPYPKPKEGDLDEGWTKDKGLVSNQDAIKEAFTGEHTQEEDPELADEVRDAFGKAKKKPDTDPEISEEIKDAFAGEEGLSPGDLEKGVPLRLPKRKEKQDSSPHQEEILDAFGGHKPDLEEAIPSQELLQETVSIGQILEGHDGKPFRFRGKALKVDRINKNNRRYKRSIVEGALKEAQDLISQGQRLTVISGHPRQGDTDPSKVVGKVEFGEIGGDDWMTYEAELADTSLGLDLQKLLREKCIGDVSLRSRGRTAAARLDGQAIEDVIDLHLRGLDLVIEGAVSGAGVDEIFNAD